MTPFADVLRRDRRHQHMSQQELANRLGVHQQEVSLWERGKFISAENKDKLVQVLGPDSELAMNLDQIDFPKPHRRRPYAEYPTKRKWVDLTLADIENLEVSLDWIAGARWAAAKLREKNA